MDDERRRLLGDLESVMEYRFKEIGFLEIALTHKSFVEEIRDTNIPDSEAGIPHYENLEFLGDAVLQLAMTHIIMGRFPYAAEGVLSKLRSQLVSEDSLYERSLALDLGRFLQLGRGEEATQGRAKKSILADIYESVMGAVYLDGGFAEAFRLIERHFGAWLTQLPENLRVEAFSRDFKSLLQELCQKRWKTIPVYSTVAQWGPDHDKCFRISVSVNGRLLGEGEGKSKKSAEQIAAEAAIAAIKDQAQSE
ncbi:MAG: ribonuclease III [Nitrospirae bacterium]|nr:ribonuclease III [Nitrospirota bacterium]